MRVSWVLVLVALLLGLGGGYGLYAATHKSSGVYCYNPDPISPDQRCIAR